MRTIVASLALTVALIETANAADCSALQIENSVKMEPLSRFGLMLVQRWTRFVRQFSGLAKVDRGCGYAANFSVVAWIA